MYMVIGYSTTITINNKILWTNIISQRTSVITGYTDPATDNVTVF